MSEQRQPDLPTKLMSVEEYLAWAEGRQGRYELFDGVVYAMAAERAIHAIVKMAAHVALLDAVKRAGASCHVMPDGMTVPINSDTSHEPDGLVYCGSPVADSSMLIPNPIIFLEVMSPSTKHVDSGLKFAGYFSRPSLHHYLIINPDRPLVIHHRRDGDAIATRIHNAGPISLDPPGLEVTVEDFYRRP